MKRWIAGLLLLALCLTMAGCGGKTEERVRPTAGLTETPTVTQTMTTTPTEEPEETRSDLRGKDRILSQQPIKAAPEVGDYLDRPEKCYTDTHPIIIARYAEEEESDWLWYALWCDLPAMTLTLKPETWLTDRFYTRLTIRLNPNERRYSFCWTDDSEIFYKEHMMWLDNGEEHDYLRKSKEGAWQEGAIPASEAGLLKNAATMLLYCAYAHEVLEEAYGSVTYRKYGDREIGDFGKCYVYEATAGNGYEQYWLYVDKATGLVVALEGLYGEKIFTVESLTYGAPNFGTLPE